MEASTHKLTARIRGGWLILKDPRRSGERNTGEWLALPPNDRHLSRRNDDENSALANAYEKCASDLRSSLEFVDRAERARVDAADSVVSAVRAARLNGASWANIAAALGITQQGAQKVYQPKVEALTARIDGNSSPLY